MYYEEDQLRNFYLELACWTVKEAAFMHTSIEDKREREELEELMHRAIVAGTLIPDFKGEMFKQSTILNWFNGTVDAVKDDTTNTGIIPMTHPPKNNADETFEAMKYFIGEFECNRKHNRTPTFDELFKILRTSDLNHWDITITPKDKRRLKQRYVRYYK